MGRKTLVVTHPAGVSKINVSADAAAALEGRHDRAVRRPRRCRHGDDPVDALEDLRPMQTSAGQIDADKS
jgi:hypothetical protein